jgi:hypothetical protein
MTVQMDDNGMPIVEAQSITPDQGLGMAALTDIRLDEQLEWLLRIEAVRTTQAVQQGRDEDEALDVRVDIESWADATKAAKAVRRQRPSRELLARVLELYEKGGIQAVETGTNYSESYCFKLLRRARQEVSE